MKVLFVAPEIEGLPVLNTWKELDQIGDMKGVILESLTGPDVTRGRVANRLSRDYDVVIFAGHGKPGKFIVSDGCLTAHWLARYIRGASPQIVLLAACHSAGHSFDTLDSLAEEISAAGIPVIAMPTAVDDDAAVVYDIEFMRAFSNGADIKESHTIALGQMRTKTNPGQMPMYFRGANANIAGSLGRIEEGFEALASQIGHLDTRFSNGQKDIVHRTDRILEEQVHITGRVRQLEEWVGELRTQRPILQFSEGLLAHADATHAA